MMSEQASRETTLKECLDRLPPSHKARVELDILKQENEALREAVKCTISSIEAGLMFGEGDDPRTERGMIRALLKEALLADTQESEYLHEWAFTMAGCYFMCVNGDCDERLYPKQAEHRLNATERLSARRARLAEKDLAAAKLANNLATDFKTIAALSAYANTLEGK